MRSFDERPLGNHFYNDDSTKLTHRVQSLSFTNNPQSSNSAVFSPCKDNFHSFISPKDLCNSKGFAPKIVFTMESKRNRRSGRVESQSSDRDENISETSFTQGNATLVDVSENVNNIFDRNLVSELTELSQISNEIEAITQRLSEQNNHKMTQFEQQLNSKFEEILKEIRTNKESDLVDDEEDVEDNRSSTSNSENRYLRKNTHQTMKSIKTEIRIIAFSPQKCMS